MKKVFEDIGRIGRRENLTLITNDFDSSILIKILGNKKTSNLKEHELLAYLYALNLAKTITEQVDVCVTPYARCIPSYDGNILLDRRDSLYLYMIEGKDNMFTRYYGTVMLESSMNITHEMVVRNEVKFYESRKILPPEKTLYDIVKSVSNDFARAGNLKFIGGSGKEWNIENYLIYVNERFR